MWCKEKKKKIKKMTRVFKTEWGSIALSVKKTLNSKRS